MCTIIVRHMMDDWCSTIIASNRDEFYDRVASGPAVLQSEPLIVGGRDAREGGTWFGLTHGGLFVGLTNQRNFATRDDSLRSRGGLVIEALEKDSFGGVESYLSRVDPMTYNEFNLIFGDGQRVCAAYGRRDAREVELEMLGEPRIKPRLVDVLCDSSLPDPSEVPPLPPGAPFDEEVARYLQAICVKTPVYGTVSSTIAAVSPGRVEQYWFSEGPPSETSFEDMVHLTRGGG
ncbi:MAG: NRDE family protein [Deltaproteobacteria bacterium]|nr:NRDE family protein [Deltaproteobacteria bacterium]